jgi:cytochrome c
MKHTIRNAAFLLAAGALAGATMAQEQAFVGGYKATMTPELAARLKAADLAAGANQFERRCSQCHDGEKTGGHSKGPFLWNVFGRKAASIAGFEFSDAMKKSGVTWDFATLDYYLADTERAVPGKTMNFPGIRDDALRAAVVMHLRAMSDNPPALP